SGDYIEDFYVLTFCKGFIISNSSFGWWAAWLSTFPDKKVIVPTPWFALPYKDKKICKDRFPKGWIKIKLK
ncbi:MAG: hypothetical protein K940chlam6_00865, partial [Chlamydiae bacterium]|nr:hypothetical protein [Chlamydiota bacterium]